MYTYSKLNFVTPLATKEVSHHDYNEKNAYNSCNVKID